MGILEDLPIMPVNSVLFPFAPTSLYIHEQRYREMLDERLETGGGVFGLSLLKAGQEVGGLGIPHEVGTIARIIAVTKLPDQSSLVMARGGPRFRIRRITELRPLVEAQVDILEDSSEMSRAEQLLVDEARQELQVLLALLLETMDAGELEVDVPEDPVKLSWAVAAHVQASLAVQQELLESSSVAARLEVTLPMLREEVSHYRVMQAARQRLDELGLPDDDAPFSRN